MIRTAIIGSPLSLINLRTEESIRYANSFLPFSTGFEIECPKSENYKESNFINIPYIMHVENDFSEQRYRIPSGLKGIVCLYLISEQLKINSELNPLSGIHYHVDCTEDYSTLINNLKHHAEYILSELESWGYIDDEKAFNVKAVGGGFNWVRTNSQFSTLEFRIGEMTFDYELLFKRIFHCNEIVKTVKDRIGIIYEEPKIEEISPVLLKNYLTSIRVNNPKVQKLRKLQESFLKMEEQQQGQERELDLDEISQIIKNRVVK